MKTLKCGPCGLFCGACGATDCEGCRSEKIDSWVKQCKFRKCAGEKNNDFCCHCCDYPCKELHDFMNDKWPHHGQWKPILNISGTKAPGNGSKTKRGYGHAVTAVPGYFGIKKCVAAGRNWMLGNCPGDRDENHSY